ncbi:MAG: tetratricopeptide repeat protein, partial [Planctomycetota bacterium]
MRIAVISLCVAGAVALPLARPALAGAGPSARRSGPAPGLSRKEAVLLREVAELAKTDRAAAVARLREAVTEKSSARLDFALAVLLHNDTPAEAEAAYLAATKKHPGFVRAWSGLGRSRLARSRPVDAASAFREAVKLDAGEAKHWKLLGYSYLLADRLAAAESAYGRALVLAPDDREVVLGLAKALLAAGRAAEALPLVREQSAVDPMNGELWLIRAGALLETGKEDGALAALETARRLGVLAPEGLLTLGDMYYNKGLYGGATERYATAFASGKVSAERMMRSAEALFHAGRHEGAAGFLERARRAGLADPATGWLLEGRIAEERSDADGARKAYRSAVEHDPLNGEALLALGRLHWRTKDYERASLAFERASRVRGFEAKALVLLAEMEVGLDRFRRAVEHLQAAQDIDPD